VAGEGGILLKEEKLRTRPTTGKLSSETSSGDSGGNQKKRGEMNSNWTIDLYRWRGGKEKWYWDALKNLLDRRIMVRFSEWRLLYEGKGASQGRRKDARENS